MLSVCGPATSQVLFSPIYRSPTSFREHTHKHTRACEEVEGVFNLLLAEKLADDVWRATMNYIRLIGASLHSHFDPEHRNY